MERRKWLYARELEQLYSLLSLWKLLRQGKPGNLARKLSLDENNQVNTSRPRVQIVSDNFRHRATKY